MINEEPLSYFLKKEGFNRLNIRKWVPGEKYGAILLKNGNIGVCATLNHPQLTDIPETIELTRISDRIFYQAYLNAILNYNNHYTETSDISGKIVFGRYQKIVMIGWFRTLAEKIGQTRAELSIFDMDQEDETICPAKHMNDTLKLAGAIFLTSTSVMNNTFYDIISQSKEICDIFTLGPSTLLDRDMFRYRNIRQLFGAVFRKNDAQLLEMIAQGHGTSTFSIRMQKVYLLP